MTGKIAYSVGSMVAVAVISMGLVFFAALPDLAGEAAAVERETVAVRAFHNKDRMPLDVFGEGPPPHGKDTLMRSFSNLHLRAMECSACHLSAKGALIRKMDDGRLALARLVDSKWVPLMKGDLGVQEMKEPPRCNECHRRRSSLLRRLYKGPRLRVLEDLSVLRYLGSGR